MFGQLFEHFVTIIVVCLCVVGIPSTTKMYFDAYKDGVFEDDYWDKKELEND